MLKLVRLNAEYSTQLMDMMDEWTTTDEKIGNSSAFRLNCYKNCEKI